MQTRYLFGAIAAFVGGPLLLAMMIEPAAPTSPGTPQAMPSAAGSTVAIIAAGTSPAAAQSTPTTADIAPGSGTLPGLASVGLERAGDGAAATETGDALLLSGFFHKLGYAGSTDDAYANALPESDFVLSDDGLAVEGSTAASGFEALPEANVDVLMLTGFAVGGGAGSGAGSGAASAGDPPVFAATEQMQLVSGVPEPESWASFIAGLALVGFNLRDRKRMRHVVC